MAGEAVDPGRLARDEEAEHREGRELVGAAQVLAQLVKDVLPTTAQTHTAHT